MKLARFLCLLSTLLLFSMLTGCSGDKKDNEKVQWKTVTVKAQTLNTPLYFSGVVAPIKTIPIISPIDGTIQDQSFSYGNQVNEGQALLTIFSAKLQENFSSAISDYLKKMEDYKTKVRQFNASKELWNLKFISFDEYDQSISDKNDAYVALLQSEYKIIKIAKQLGVYEQLLKIKKITPELTKEFLLQSRNTIQVLAPKTGIALFPVAGSGSDSAKPVKQGMEIKSGQVLLDIGDLSGYLINVKVSEVDINQIKVGQAAEVTGPAFPSITLKGHVSSVNAQAKSDGSSLPEFPISVEVTKVTPKQQKIIHIGMSAKVAINLQTPNVITLPIDAVFQKDGKTMVKVKGKDGKITDTSVITGQTTLDNVVIKEGLKPGEVVVYHN